MTLSSPEWLILVPLLLLIGWRNPRLGLSRPLRTALCATAVLLTVDPAVRLISDTLDVWVLIDRSASAQSTVAPNLPEWERLLSGGKRASDQLTFIDYADVAVVRGEGDANYFEKSREETRTALAVRTALSRLDPKHNNRIIVLSDGYSTEPLSSAAELLRRSDVALDYRIPAQGFGGDTQLEQVQVPERVQPGETFMIELKVAGESTGDVPVKLFRNEALLFEGMVPMSAGRGRLRLADALPAGARSYEYKARIEPPGDRFSGNNTAVAWTEVFGPKVVLVITSYADDPLPKILASKGIEARVVDDPAKLEVGLLGGTNAVILNNVAASHVPRNFLKALHFFVLDQGGGLLMTGGRNSFGSGGYFQSDIDKLLPVSMELREEERRVSTAMALILDRSGSMAANVEGNLGNMTKMDLANEGAARTISLLGSRDKLAIFAVDSEPHTVVPLTALQGSESSMMSKARSIESAGGGIYVYTGLVAAAKELEAEKKLQRHIILFADAADAEEPGEYRALLAKLTKEKTTVTAIGLGKDTDPDAELLKDVAKLGGGRVFFVSNAMDLPAVFAQETVSVARSTFVTNPTQLSATASWRQISSFAMTWPDAVDGYNLNYLRPQASAALLSKDEYKSPLLAMWQRGLGRVATIGFPVAGEYSERVRGWESYGDFLHTVIHWLRGPELPAGIQLRTRVTGRVIGADLYYDRSWEERVALTAPKLMFSSGVDGGAKTIEWERVGPGHFRSSYRSETGEPVRGSVQIGEYTLPFGPVALGRDAEWSFDRRLIHELDETARESGGGERVNLGEIWDVPRKTRDLRLRPYLLVGFLLVFLLEALLSRLNRTVPMGSFSFDLKQSWKERHFKAVAEVPLPADENPKFVEPEPQTPEEQIRKDQAEKRKNLFDRAKKGGV